MRGSAIVRKSEPELSDIPVIMLTIVDDKNMGYTLGAADYLTKPIDRDRLIAALKKFRCPNPPCQLLLVEDDALTRDTIRKSMEEDGWGVTEALWRPTSPPAEDLRDAGRDAKTETAPQTTLTLYVAICYAPNQSFVEVSTYRPTI